jgi:hypothetical protein
LPILLTLMLKAIRSAETSALIRAKWRHISEDNIIHTSNSDTIYSSRIRSNS